MLLTLKRVCFFPCFSVGSVAIQDMNPVARLASPDFSPGSRMLAQESCAWTPLWSERGSRSYHLSEQQVQVHENQPGPG
jgi:hypothetical protein